MKKHSLLNHCNRIGIRLVMLVLTMILLAACAANAMKTPSPPKSHTTTIVPDLTPAFTERMTALTIGTIIYEKGCLRLVEGSGTTRSLVWPSDVVPEVDLETNTVTVHNPDGQQIRITLGSDVVRVDGGGIGLPEANQRDVIDDSYGTELCPPPFWLVAKVSLQSTPAP